MVGSNHLTDMVHRSPGVCLWSHSAARFRCEMLYVIEIAINGPVIGGAMSGHCHHRLALSAFCSAALCRVGRSQRTRARFTNTRGAPGWVSRPWLVQSGQRQGDPFEGRGD